MAPFPVTRTSSITTDWSRLSAGMVTALMLGGWRQRLISSWTTGARCMCTTRARRAVSLSSGTMARRTSERLTSLFSRPRTSLADPGRRGGHHPGARALSRTPPDRSVHRRLHGPDRHTAAAPLEDPAIAQNGADSANAAQPFQAGSVTIVVSWSMVNPGAGRVLGALGDNPLVSLGHDPKIIRVGHLHGPGDDSRATPVAEILIDTYDPAVRQGLPRTGTLRGEAHYGVSR
jgi:hypothetical protein